MRAGWHRLSLSARGIARLLAGHPDPSVTDFCRACAAQAPVPRLRRGRGWYLARARNTSAKLGPALFASATCRMRTFADTVDATLCRTSGDRMSQLHGATATGMASRIDELRGGLPGITDAACDCER
jgi:hypothetical protein